MIYIPFFIVILIDKRGDKRGDKRYEHRYEHRTLHQRLHTVEKREKRERAKEV